MTSTTNTRKRKLNNSFSSPSRSHALSDEVATCVGMIGSPSDLTFATSPRGLRRCSPAQSGSAKGDRPLAGTKRTRLATSHPLTRRCASSSSLLTPSSLKALPLISITSSPSTSYRQVASHDLLGPLVMHSRPSKILDDTDQDMPSEMALTATHCGEPTTPSAPKKIPTHAVDVLGGIRSPFANRLAASPPAVVSTAKATVDSAIYAVSNIAARQTYAHNLRVCNACGRTATNTISLASYKKCSICPGYACTFCQRFCGDGSLKPDAPQVGRCHFGNVKKIGSKNDESGYDANVPCAVVVVSQQHCGQRVCRACCTESGLGVPTCSKCSAAQELQPGLLFHILTDSHTSDNCAHSTAIPDTDTDDAEMSLD